MASFNIFIDCNNDSYETLNVADILQHSQYPFCALSPTKLNQYNTHYPTGNKKEIVVRPREPTVAYPYEHYEALCNYALIQKLRQTNEDTCQCYVKRELTDSEALAEMLVNTISQSDFISLTEKSMAYELLYQSVFDKAYEMVGECEASFHKIRGLIHLIPPLITLVEENCMSVQAAAQLFSLDKDTQKVIYNYLLTCNKKLTLPIALALNRYASEIGNITSSTLITIFGGTG